MYRFIIISLSLLLIDKGFGQKIFSLEECIETAIKNSQLTRLADLNVRDAAIDVLQSKQAMLPTADAGLGHGLNFGRSIDPSTNGFINEQITRGGFYGQSNIPIWQAGGIKQGIKQFNFAKEAAQWELKNQEDLIRLQVTMAYLQILNAQEISTRTIAQEATTSEQVKRLQNLNEQGAILPSQFSDMQGQYALDQMNSLDALQAIKTAQLELAQLMNIPFDLNMQFKADRTLTMIDKLNIDAAALERAKRLHPMIQFQEASIKSAEFSLNTEKARRYPRLSLGIDLGSNYSSAFEIGGEKVKYPRQLSNNFNYSGLLSLNMPILNGYRTRAAISKAENAIKRAQVNNDLAKNMIQQKIEQAVMLQANAIERYDAINRQVNAFSESFRIAESRFNEGALNSVDYLIAKNNLDRAQNQLIAAKYEWAFRNKIIEYYMSIK